MPVLDALREDALFVRELAALRVDARFAPRVLVRAGVRVAFLALAICNRPLGVEGVKTQDNNQRAYMFHTIVSREAIDLVFKNLFPSPRPVLSSTAMTAGWIPLPLKNTSLL